MVKRASEEGARFFRVHRVNPKLKTDLFWTCWKQYQETIPWPQFFVYYQEYFNEGFKRAKNGNDI